VFVQTVRLRERQAVNRTYELEETDLCELDSSVTSGFRSDVGEIYALLGYYAAYGGNSLPTFRDNLSVPSQRVNKSKKDQDKANVGVCEQGKKNWRVH
jgi:hypothetical protein